MGASVIIEWHIDGDSLVVRFGLELTARSLTGNVSIIADL